MGREHCSLLRCKSSHALPAWVGSTRVDFEVSRARFREHAPPPRHEWCCSGLRAITAAPISMPRVRRATKVTEPRPARVVRRPRVAKPGVRSARWAALGRERADTLVRASGRCPCPRSPVDFGHSGPESGSRVRYVRVGARAVERRQCPLSMNDCVRGAPSQSPPDFGSRERVSAALPRQ